jgi:hypothetical protein
MPRSKQLQFAVFFARFCQEHKVTISSLSEMIELARKAFRAGEQMTDSRTHDRAKKRYDRVTNAFNAIAKQYGFDVDWSGLWPNLVEDQGDGTVQYVHLPSF